MIAVPNQDAPLIPAVYRALNILEFVAQKRDPASIKDVAESLNIPNTTAFRLVKQLLSRGYLEESENRPGYYHLGLQILTLSKGMTYVNDLRQVAHIALNRLAIESRQAVQMGILKGDNVTYIEQILPPNPVLIYTTPYAELPLNISAAGKVLAAFSSEDILQRLIRNARFIKQTPKAIDNTEEFLRHLETVRHNGYAEDNEEFAIGIGCMAAPVFDHDGKCVAAVGITGSIQEYQGENKRPLISMLLRSAEAISQKVGMPQKDL